MRDKVDLENSLGESVEQAETIAGVVSLIWNMFDEACDEGRHAKTNNEEGLAHYGILTTVSTLMPVLRMLTNYAEDNQAKIKQISANYEENIRNIGKKVR